jgi:O-antigen ligase
MKPWHILGLPNHIPLGRLIGIGLPIVVYYATVSDKKRKYVIMFVIIFIGLLVSSSRGPTIAALLSSAIIMLTKTNNIGLLTAIARSKISIWLPVGSVIIVLLYIFQPPTIVELLPVLQGDLGRSETLRLRYIRSSIHFWLNSPIYGNGLASFGHQYNGSTSTYPHNIILEIANDTGVIGLLPFFIILLSIIKNTIWSMGKSDVNILLFAVFMFIFINANVSGNIIINRELFMIVMLTAGTGR